MSTIAAAHIAIDRPAEPRLAPPPERLPAVALVRVRHLRKVFDVSAPWITRVTTGQGRKTLKAVDDISFEIPQGRTLSLVGESGCGKSTAARCIAGLQKPTSGTVSYRDTPIEDIADGASPYRRDIQMIFQDPYGSLNPRWRVGRIIAEPILALKLADGSRDVRERVADLLVGVGLSAADADKYPHEFSGGQRQRIAVARALASRPAFIVCDEPTSALDVSVQAQILNLMRDLQDELRLTYLFISHNLAVVDHMSDTVGVMYLGRIVELADKETLFRSPRHPYSKLLMRTMPTLHSIGAIREPMQGEVPNPIDPPHGCAFNPRCPFAVERCRHERPEIRAVDGSLVACHRAEEIAQ
ncbi:dipeptide ABC transporter ATP binding subunit DppF [Chelatococcus asaccharovorans]|nr:dipeptide ABC transporter ATP binding subunit DppF [Chelatococcus asaccharovorans]CAH1694146.1 dipeptide ABC transporter ATP binding subunit DppF [Chelatococcus asaccharovorans]